MKATTLQFLIDRHLARRLAQRTGDMKPEGLFLLVQSLLTAALVNPAPIVKHMRRFQFLDRQISTQRGLIRPRIISINCSDDAQRQALCRAMLAVTAEVAAALDDSVLPDPTTILAAMLERWIVEMETPDRKRLKAAPQPMESIARPAKRFRRDNLPPIFPKKKAPPRKSRRERVHAHPEFPDVQKKPITWRPGTRGRPPKGACCNERGVWTPPDGFRVIRGLWHGPIRPREPLSPSTDALWEDEQYAAQEDGTSGDGEPDTSAFRPVRGAALPSPEGTTPEPPQIRSGEPAPAYDERMGTAAGEIPDGKNEADGPW